MIRTFGKPFCPSPGLTHLFPLPEVLADAALQSIGLSLPKANAIRTLARDVRNEQISFQKVADSDVFLAKFSRLPGVQERTTQWIAMRALREPDAFPSADRELAGALMMGNSSEFEQHSLAWCPWRAYAAIYLWFLGRDMAVLGNAATFSASGAKVAATERLLIP